MLGGNEQRGPLAGAMDQLGGSRTPGGGGEGGDLGRQAGLDDIGGGRGRTGLFDSSEDRDYERSAGLFDTAENEAEYDDADFDDDLGGGPDEDTA
jgi:hypothetical protein